MSARFWLFSSLCGGAALTGGLGLGIYATTQPRVAWTETSLPETPVEQRAFVHADLNGPSVIDCKGCGPTLADRQMMADRAAWDGSDDAFVRDYAAQDDQVPEDYVDPLPYQGAVGQPRTLPATVERFAAGGQEASWGGAKIAEAPPQNPESGTSAHARPADVAISY
ncbi:hypothetical protein [Sphingobium sp. Sx8-8]|uniref:hypothetical protein n=1 Tax=Sphingobium sp. Sx8-8 TaxID=2933617 RepID=UPI001F57CD16|nr:hypothetical protein [Sphingobium sp. Sx8-8]